MSNIFNSAESRKAALRQSWKLAGKALVFTARQSTRAAVYLYNRMVPEKIRNHPVTINTGRTFSYGGGWAKKLWHKAACEAGADGRPHFSKRRLMVSTALATGIYMATNAAYVFGTADTYRNVVVTARDAEAKGEYQIAGKIFTKDESGVVTENKRMFQITPSLLRTNLWHTELVYKDIPADSLCDFKTHGIYWYSMFTQGVVHKPIIYQANCHPMTQDEKRQLQTAQAATGDNESRVEKFTYGVFDKDYGFFPKTPVRTSTAALTTAQPWRYGGEDGHNHL